MKFIKILLIVLIIIAFVYFIYLVFHCKRTNKLLLKYFKESSVIVYGAKGTGKDLLFQKIIYLKRNKPYLANMSYGYLGEITPIKELSVMPNTYEQFIKGNIELCDKKPNFEGKDYYLSDAGTYLPAQYYDKLNKQYPSLPIYYALSRQLYNQNIHINSQYLNRAWNLIREQADKYIKCISKLKIGKLGILCQIIMYDKYESADKGLLPLKKPRALIGGKEAKQMYEQYCATNGEIIRRRYWIRLKDIQYDTRHFHKVVFGNKYIENYDEKLDIRKEIRNIRKFIHKYNIK